jgi:predicted DsbA family dithiol-disulfide isomerase
MMCLGSKEKEKKCVESAGIPLEKFESCLGDAALVKRLQAAAAAAGKDVTSFPKVVIAGKDESYAAQDEKSLLSALCSAGAKAAC